jgi:antirestriction protein ArdC
MKSERFDIHQHITDQIIAAIESGAGEFRLPWHRSAGNIMYMAMFRSQSRP